MSSDRNLRFSPSFTHSSLVDWDMSSDRNCNSLLKPLSNSLVDWDMSSDRNWNVVIERAVPSLVDWDMSSDRNQTVTVLYDDLSLVDWDMSSDRRRWLDWRFAPVKPTPAPRRAVYQVTIHSVSITIYCYLNSCLRPNLLVFGLNLQVPIRFVDGTP